MKSSATPGWFQRAWSAIKRGLLGKSSHEYMKQFTGSDEYWDEAIAAQRGWPQTGPAGKSEPGNGSPGDNQNETSDKNRR